MAHYAQIDQKKRVIYVFVGRDEDDLAEGVTDWEEYYAPEGFTVKRTSYNTRAGVHYDIQTGKPSANQDKAFRGNFATIGMIYDADLDAFIHEQPFPSWVLNAESFTWEAPIPRPEGDWVWDEDAGDWVAVETPGA